ncbi:DoxX family protein [Aquimarina spongiae]|uniref:DoxX-like family protein n=1 Tax=Aquimarina spongiae TaxID=570521 RepID=A0A1M6H5F6_9FLAO|nr:DoxX family protein [Aquimarina spongiae]SHJ17349.1 DoxX-like family protein [Aquimarina spongiae]
MKKNKMIYWTATILMSLLFILSASMYLFNYERASGFFINLGFPTWLIYPLAILKVLGVLTILTKKSTFLKELAYSGFLFDALLALTAHLMVRDHEYMPALLSIVFIITSWAYDRKVFGNYKQTIINHGK